MKIKQLPTRFFVGAYSGAITVDEKIRPQFRDGLNVLNMVVYKKDIAGKVRVHQHSSHGAMTAAAKKAIQDGMVAGVTDPENKEEVENVKHHNLIRISTERIEKIGEALTNNCSAIICVFDEILVPEGTFQTDMKEHQEKLTERVKSQIEMHLADKKDVAVNVVLDEHPEKVALFELVVGDAASTDVRSFIDKVNPQDVDKINPRDVKEGNEGKNGSIPSNADAWSDATYAVAVAVALAAIFICTLSLQKMSGGVNR